MTKQKAIEVLKEAEYLLSLITNNNSERGRAKADKAYTKLVEAINTIIK